MNEINALLDNGEFEEALKQLESLPESAEVMACKGRTLGKLNQYEQARECATRALEIDPSCGDAHNTLAVVAASGGALPQALQHANSAVQSNPKEIRYLLTRATLLANIGETEAAVADLGTLEQFPEAPKFAPERAQVRAALGQIEQAQALLDKANPEVCSALAIAKASLVLAGRSGDLPGAAKASHQLARLRPKDSTGWMQTYQIYRAYGDNDSALACLEEGLGHLPGDEELGAYRTAVLLGLGRARDAFEMVVDWVKDGQSAASDHAASLEVLADNGYKSEVIALVDRCLPNSPKRSFDMIFRAVLCDEKREALKYWGQAFQTDPRAEVIYEVGVAMLQRGFLREAAASFQKATEMKPDFHEAFHNWGHCLQESGQLEEAIERYNAALKFEPELFDSYNNRGNCYRSLAQFELSLADHARARELAPGNPMPLQNRATTLIELRRMDEARADLEELVQIAPDSAPGFHLLGLVLYYDGQEADAQAFYERACELDPSFLERPYHLMIQRRVSGPQASSEEGPRQLDEEFLRQAADRVQMQLAAAGQHLPPLSEDEIGVLFTAVLAATLRALAVDGTLVLGPLYEQFSGISEVFEAHVPELKTAEEADDVMVGHMAAIIGANFPHHLPEMEDKLQFVSGLASIIRVCVDALKGESASLSGVNWNERAREFDRIVTELGVAELPFRYDLNQGQYFWMEGDQAVALAEIQVIGTYSELGRSFLSGWANPGAGGGGAWPDPLPDIPDEINELDLQNAWQVAATIAEDLGVEFLQSVSTGQLKMFLGFSNIRRAGEGDGFSGATQEDARGDTLRKIATIREQLEGRSMTPVELAELCRDFAGRMESSAADLYRDTPVARQLVTSAQVFHQLSKALREKELFMRTEPGLPPEVAQRLLAQLEELNSRWM